MHTHTLSLSLSLSQFLIGLLNYLETICIPTRPCEVRVAVANELSHIWSTIVKTSYQKKAMGTYCQLVLNLLQDSDIDVRSCAATTVAMMLPSLETCTTTLSYVAPAISVGTVVPFATSVAKTPPSMCLLMQ